MHLVMHYILHYAVLFHNHGGYYNGLILQAFEVYNLQYCMFSALCLRFLHQTRSEAIISSMQIPMIGNTITATSSSLLNPLLLSSDWSSVIGTDV